MYKQTLNLRRAVLPAALMSLWFLVAYNFWLQAFYKVAPESFEVHAKDKQARTLLDPEVYSLHSFGGEAPKSINTSRSKYLMLQEGDIVCYSYNSLFGHKFNFQHRHCWQTDSYHPVLKLQDLLFGDD